VADTRKCANPGCDRLRSTRTICDRCYFAEYRAKRRAQLPPLEERRAAYRLERFWARVDKNGPNGCWLWTGTHDGHHGYGRLKVDGHRTGAHRVAYELLVGPIPDGLFLDHLCRNPPCVNPAHLEPVTNRENVMRSPITLAYINSSKTHCPQGHPYDEANTIHSPAAGRLCRTCLDERQRERNKWPRGPRTHCPQGHEYSPENTYYAPNAPQTPTCRICARDRYRRWYDRQKVSR
jgi:hypothetical protein